MNKQNQRRTFSLKSYKTKKEQNSIPVDEILENMKPPEKLMNLQIIDFFRLSNNAQTESRILKNHASKLTDNNEKANVYFSAALKKMECAFFREEGAKFLNDPQIRDKAINKYAECDGYFQICEKNYRNLQNSLMKILSKLLQVICKFRIFINRKKRYYKMKSVLQKAIEGKSILKNEEHLTFHKDLLNFHSVFEKWEQYRFGKVYNNYTFLDFDILNKSAMDAIIFVKSVSNFDYSFEKKILNN
ncbi:hypothetical protein M0813_20784 [Anaeramoeba flamelloides]|uniref:Uncharacterized protein n=1 Tax=Anaeramoeba flamelloides TaxID=1746091 RepID=A0ABQ8YK02_9EUKA|nr:hypothetical protein M0813_20784 [Anaeramoeba flamelloides]